MSATTLEKIKKVTCEGLGVSEGEVAEDKRFIDDLNADSLDVVELVMAFEEEFDIDIPDEDVPNLRTVGDAVEYVEKKLAEK